MMILDESGSSDGDSSCTLMYFPPIRDKGKFVGFPPRRKEKTPRVLQIGGNFEEVGEGEIEGVMEAIKRSKVDLGLGGTNWDRNSNTHGEGSSGGILGQQVELGRGGGSTGAGRSACAGTSRLRVGSGSA